MNRIVSFVRLSRGVVSSPSFNSLLSRFASQLLAGLLLVSVGLPAFADTYPPITKYRATYYVSGTGWVNTETQTFNEAAQLAWDNYVIPPYWPNTTKIDWYTNQITPHCDSKDEPDLAALHLYSIDIWIYSSIDDNGAPGCVYTNHDVSLWLYCPHNGSSPSWDQNGVPYCTAPCDCGEVQINGQCVPDVSYDKEWQASGDLWVYPEGGDGRVCEVEDYPQKDNCADSKNKGNGPRNTAGNPISCTTGIKTQTETDYRSAGPDPLVVQRHYQSSVEDPTQFGLPEYGIMRLTYDPDREIARLDWPDGGIYMFVINNGVGASNDADKGTLTQTAGGWDYHTASGRLYQFDANGGLVTQQKPGGQVQTVTYYTSGPGLGKIATVTNTFGLTLTYDYDAQGRVSDVQIPGGEVISYSYDAQNRLTTVTYPDETPLDNNDNPTRVYHYENANFPNSLTGITDETGQRFATWAYDAVGKAVLSEHDDAAEKVTLEYTDATHTTVKTYLSATEYREQIYTFEKLGGHDRITQIETLPCTGCTAGTETWQYNPSGFLIQHTDLNGNVTTYQRNSRGLETSRTEAVGTADARTVTTVWHADFDLPTQITEPGRTTTYTYDTAGNRLTESVTDTTGLCEDGQGNGCTRTTTYTYDSNGLLLTVNGPRTSVTDLTTFGYDAQGNRTSVTNALNQVTQISVYDAHDNPLTVIDPNGVHTDLQYDARQRLVSRTVAAGTADAATTTFDYDGVGDITKITQPDGAYLQYTYDGAHRLIAVEDNLGNRIDYTLDVMGHRTAQTVKDPNGVLTGTQSAVYNALGQLLDQVGANSQTTSYQYDANGNTIQITDPKTQTTTQAFDALNRLIQIEDPVNGVTAPTQYTYDAQGNLTQVTDPKALSTSYQYNGFGELLEQTSPDTGVTDYAYDAAGNRTAQTDARGVTVVYDYDALNRLTQITYPNPAENVYYDYDEDTNGIGRLKRITDETGAAEYSYDARGNVIDTTINLVINGQPQSYTIGYQYDTADRITQITYPSGRTVDYTRDSTGRITAVSTAWNGHVQTLAQSIAYRPFGPVSQFTYGNGLTETRSYDLDNRLTGITVAGVHDLDYGYDPNSNVLNLQNLLNTNQDQTFGYDALDRLTDATGIYGVLNYGYDPVGNRLSKTDDSVTETYTYDTVSHHLLQRDTTSYQYDAVGNTTNNGQFTFTYNQANRLSDVEDNGTPVAYYLYNALGQRVVKTVGNTVVLYFYDLNGQLIAEHDLARNTHTEYVTLDGRPLAQIEPRPDLWATIQEHTLTDTQDPNQTATVTVDTQAQTLAFTLSAGGGQTYASPPQWTETNYNDQRYLEIADPQTGETSGYAVDYSLHLYEDAVNATLHLTPMDGSPERYFTLTTTIADTPPVMYTHTDHLGTPRALTDQNQQIVWQADYNPFGMATITTGQVTNNLRFPGQYFDGETGFYYNYFRDYDPSLGRYLQSDPIGLDGGINAYGYVEGNPLRYSDPLGLQIGCATTLDCQCRTPTPVAQANCRDAGGIPLPPLEMAAPGNVADTQIVQDYGEAASEARQCGEEPPDRCKWLEENKSRYRSDQVKKTQKAWGCRRSRNR